MKKRMMAALLALGLLAGCSPAAENPSGSEGAGSTPPAQYEQVTLWCPGENADSLEPKSVQIERTGDPAEELVQALAAEGALPAGAEVVKWSSDGDEPPALTVDMNEAFAEGLLNQGTAGETMILASLVNTLWEYYEPASLILTADGRAIETGHNIYDAPFTERMLVG